jgi:hypothetical protein
VLEHHEEETAVFVTDDLDEPHEVLVCQQLHHLDLSSDRLGETGLGANERVRGQRDERERRDRGRIGGDGRVRNRGAIFARVAEI